MSVLIAAELYQSTTDPSTMHATVVICLSLSFSIIYTILKIILPLIYHTHRIRLIYLPFQVLWCVQDLKKLRDLQEKIITMVIIMINYQLWNQFQKTNILHSFSRTSKHIILDLTNNYWPKRSIVSTNNSCASVILYHRICTDPIS